MYIIIYGGVIGFLYLHMSCTALEKKLELRTYLNMSLAQVLTGGGDNNHRDNGTFLPAPPSSVTSHFKGKQMHGSESSTEYLP